MTCKNCKYILYQGGGIYCRKKNICLVPEGSRRKTDKRTAEAIKTGKTLPMECCEK